MNIFIDTSVIYTDPFWKRNFSRQLINAAKLKRLNIFISDVVIRELRKNYKSQLETEIANLTKVERTLDKLLSTKHALNKPDIEKHLKEFDRFYKELFTEPNIIKLDCNKNFFDDILERAIQEIKPFSKGKAEFKDAVIWTTYYSHAKKELLQNCHFLTNNKSDFTNPNGGLHDDLKKDYDKFELHITIDDFYKNNNSSLDKPVTEFEDWLVKRNIDENYIFRLVLNDTEATDRVFYELDSKYHNVDPSFLNNKVKLSVPFNGYIIVTSIEWNGCKNIDTDIISDYSIISGTLPILTTLQMIETSSNFNGKESHSDFLQIKLLIHFNFSFDQEEKVKNFEVTRIEEI